MTAAAPAQAPPEFPPAISSAVREATVALFTAHFGWQPVEEPAGPPDAPCNGIMGVISFFGDPAWSFALALPESTAVTVARQFTGFDIPFDSPDMGDLVGEIANIIAGDLVARLEAKGIRSQMSLPTLARGHDVELLCRSDAATTRMGFGGHGGRFWFKLVKARQGSPLGRRPGA